MVWYNDDLGWWSYAGMGIGMVLFWALIIVGIVALVRYTTVNAHGSPPTPPSPEHELATRFARGEISETEYRDRLAVLRDHTRQ